MTCDVSCLETYKNTTRAFQECEQAREKSRDTVNRVPLTNNRLRAPFIARQKQNAITL